MTMEMPWQATCVLAVILAILTGCATADELRERDEAACIGYGFQPGTAEFATCLQREGIARRRYMSSYWMHGYYSPYWMHGW
jgi:hypothetical protein